MSAVAELHGLLGLALLVVLGALAVAAGIALLGRRAPPVLDRARRIGLGVVVAQAALGLALAFRGASPAEGIHWLYGAAIVVALLIPSSVNVTTERARGGLLAASTALAAVFAWRLWGSG